MELRQLRYLVTIAEEQSFTRAAERLYVSQSALSQQVKQLEGELGVQLLDRSGRRVLLTLAGEALLRHGRRALCALDEATAEIGELEALQRGSLLISAVETVVAYIIPRAVSQFTQAYPGIQLRVEERPDEAIEQRLLAGEADLGIGFVPSVREEIETEALYEERLSLIVTGTHPLAGCEAVQLADLDRLPLVLLPTSSCTRRQWDSYAAQADVTAQILVEMNSIHGILQAVAQTNTATVLPALASRTSAVDRFISIPLVNPTPKRTVGVLYRRHGYRSRAAQAFVTILRALAQTISGAS